VPVSRILELAAIRTGRESLLSLDLDVVAARIRQEPWIRAVELVKHPPQTLEIRVAFRQPIAIVQLEDGSLSYVDSKAEVFGAYELRSGLDLPVITVPARLPGTGDGVRGFLMRAVNVLALWERALPLEEGSRLSQLNWSEDGGFEGWLEYSTAAVEKGAPRARYRASVLLGQDEASLESGFARLRSVLRYLHDHRIAARQILADTDKKIIVRRNRDS